MTRGLVLVDLDNVLWKRRLKTVVQHAQKVQGQVGRIDEWLVVFAMNTKTAGDADEGLTFAALHDAGAMLGAPGSRTEIALALTMPQTADVLIARLARESPSTEGAGAYEAAILLSMDEGLRSDLGLELYETSARRWSHTRETIDSRDSICSWWRMPEGGATIVRKAPRATKPRKARAPELAQVYTACVAKAEAAAWAASHRLDVGLELEGVAASVDREPWLLSQVGATASSLRGICRLSEVGTAALTLGVVNEKDGVEVLGEAKRPEQGRKPSAASVGIGAVRFAGSATIASRLSASVLEHVEEVAVETLGLNVLRSIWCLPNNDEPLGKEVKVRLSFSRRRRSLVAKVQNSSTTQPQAWWIYDKKKTSSELDAPCGELLSAAVVTTGLCYRPGNLTTATGERILLALRCPSLEGEQLKVGADIRPGSIGPGWTQPRHGKAKPIAIYSTRPLREGATISVVPIHQASSNVPESLRPLPLVVPA